MDLAGVDRSHEFGPRHSDGAQTLANAERDEDLSGVKSGIIALSMNLTEPTRPLPAEEPMDTTRC